MHGDIDLMNDMQIDCEPGGRRAHVAAHDMLGVLAEPWQAISDAHPELPPVVLAVGRGPVRRTKSVLFGHFAPANWQPVGCAEVPGEIREASERRQEAAARGDLMEMIQAGAIGFMHVPNEIVDMSYRLRREVYVTDDSLADGAEDVLNTQLHEAAHLLANVRGTRDTSSRGRYHNGRFRELARELGLEGMQRDRNRGWSAVATTGAAKAQYEKLTARLAVALERDPWQAARGDLVPRTFWPQRRSWSAAAAGT
jgi:hypothetical protein